MTSVAVIIFFWNLFNGSLIAITSCVEIRFLAEYLKEWFENTFYRDELSIIIIIIIMIDILYFVESESSINAAIYIIQTLYQCDIGVKLEAVRQVGFINILSFFFKTVIIIILSVLSFHHLSNLTPACLLQPFLTYRWSNWIVMGHWRCK